METYIDVDYTDELRENQANQFAANILIPLSDADDLPGLKSHAAVETFAESIGIAPGIVVGRLQHEKIIPYRNLNRLKERYQWAEN